LPVGVVAISWHHGRVGLIRGTLQAEAGLTPGISELFSAVCAISGGIWAQLLASAMIVVVFILMRWPIPLALTIVAWPVSYVFLPVGALAVRTAGALSKARLHRRRGSRLIAVCSALGYQNNLGNVIVM